MLRRGHEPLVKSQCWGKSEEAARRCAWQGDEPALVEDELRELLGHNVMPLLRLLYAQAAASCSALSRALSCSCPRRQARPRPSSPAARRRRLLWRSCGTLPPRPPRALDRRCLTCGPPP